VSAVNTNDLPEPGQPLTLADGRVVNPTNGRVADNFDAYVRIPSNTEAQRLVAGTRRKLADLPDLPDKLNPISIILTYTLFGLSDDEISVALSIPTERIVAIKMLDAYLSMYRGVVDNVRATDEDDVRHLIRQHARSATGQLVRIMHEGEDDKVKLAAARDVLDRAGHRPADVVEVRNKMDSTLRIEHIVRREGQTLPHIDADFDAVD
jgi:hypothetical protein